MLAGAPKKFKLEVTIFKVGVPPGPGTHATNPSTVGPLSPITETTIPGGPAGSVIKASLPDNPGIYLGAAILEVGHLDAFGQVTGWEEITPMGVQMVTVP